MKNKEKPEIPIPKGYSIDKTSARYTVSCRGLPLQPFRATKMAQKAGFEPALRYSRTTPLAGEPLEPLGYFCTFWLAHGRQRLPCQIIIP